MLITGTLLSSHRCVFVCPALTNYRPCSPSARRALTVLSTGAASSSRPRRGSAATSTSCTSPPPPSSPLKSQ